MVLAAPFPGWSIGEELLSSVLHQLLPGLGSHPGRSCAAPPAALEFQTSVSIIKLEVCDSVPGLCFSLVNSEELSEGSACAVCSITVIYIIYILYFIYSCLDSLHTQCQEHSVEKWIIHTVNFTARVHF